MHCMHKQVIEDDLRKAHRRISNVVIHKHHMEKFAAGLKIL